MDITQWYENEEVIFEIVKQLYNKEVAFLGETKARCIVSPNKYTFDTNMKRFHIGKKRANIYKTMSRFDFKGFFKDFNFERPCFSYSYNIRRNQMDIFNEKSNLYVTNFDLGMDFDAHRNEDDTEKEIEDAFKLAYDECGQVKALLDKHKVRYCIKSSGSGFHIDVDEEDLPEKIRILNSIEGKLELIKEMMKQLYQLLGLETLDIGIDDQDDDKNWGFFYDHRRLWKVAYSYDIKTGNIALPLTDEQFNNFSYDILKPEYIKDNINIRGRGLLYREGVENAFENLLEDLGIEI